MDQEQVQSSITVEWHSLFRDIRHNLWLLVLAALVAWMGLYIATHSIYSPEYTSTATLVVRAKVGSADVYSNLTTSSDMAEIFTHVFEQPAMKTLAAENLDIPSFSGTISSSVQGATNLMDLSVTSEDPETAFQLLCSVLEVYPNISEAVFTDAVIDVIRTPKLPVAPSNTISAERQGTIILMAVLLESALIVVLSLLRNTVKNEKDFNMKVDAKLLGTIVHGKSGLPIWQRLRGKKQGILITDAFTSLKFCEDYHKLATKMEYLQKSKGYKSFAVTSIAENEGKSTAAVNMALALTERGYHVALLDMDVRRPAIYKILDKKEDSIVEFSDVLSGKLPFSQMRLYRYRKSDLLLALNKTPRSSTTRWIDGKLAREFLRQMREKVDFILLDTCPLSVSADSLAVAGLADCLTLVVRTDCVPAEDINDTVLMLKNSGINLEGCILNDLYSPFDLFGQMGENEQRGFSSSRYGGRYGYSKYTSVFSEEGPGEDSPDQTPIL